MNQSDTQQPQRVILVPVTLAQLRWTLDMKTVAYAQPRRQMQLTLFDDDDAPALTPGELVAGHVVLLAADGNLPHSYITSVPLAPDCEAAEVGSDDLELLSWPADEGAATGGRYVLLDVDTTNPLKPSLNISAERLDAYLASRQGSVVTLDELRQAGVVTTDGWQGIPDEARDRLMTLRPKQATGGRAPVAKSPVRATRELLRVTWPDGTVMCDSTTTATFAQAIEKIGPDRVAELGMEFCKTPLLARDYSPNRNYRAAQHEIAGGWLLFCCNSTASKMLLLMAISKKLGLDLKVEKGTDFKPVSKTAKKGPRSARQSLLVTLPDGRHLAGENSRDTYCAALRHIGLDKLLRLTTVKVGGVPLVTTRPVAGAVQTDELGGLHITVPNGTKRMYKFLMIAASFTHTKLTVTII